jgi:hypothetical protein
MGHHNGPIDVDATMVRLCGPCQAGFDRPNSRNEFNKDKNSISSNRKILIEFADGASRAPARAIGRE